MSDTTLATSPAPTANGFGTFDEDGNYTPREVVADDLGMSFADAIDGTMVEVEDGQLVNGTIVKIDKDEVLLDHGLDVVRISSVEPGAYSDDPPTTESPEYLVIARRPL